MSKRLGDAIGEPATLPLSVAQTEVWLAQRLAPTDALFNVGGYIEISGTVDHQALTAALRRALHEAGSPLSGIGDSAPARDRKPPLAACLEQVRDVIDSVARTYHITRFVLIGLCSGADHAILHASNDERVAGLALVDPTLPPTLRYYLHYVL